MGERRLPREVIDRGLGDRHSDYHRSRETGTGIHTILTLTLYNLSERRGCRAQDVCATRSRVRRGEFAEDGGEIIWAGLRLADSIR